MLRKEVTPKNHVLIRLPRSGHKLRPMRCISPTVTNIPKIFHGALMRTGYITPSKFEPFETRTIVSETFQNFQNIKVMSSNPHHHVWFDLPTSHFRAFHNNNPFSLFLSKSLVVSNDEPLFLLPETRFPESKTKVEFTSWSRKPFYAQSQKVMGSKDECHGLMLPLNTQPDPSF